MGVFVKQIRADNWIGPRCDGLEADWPSLDDIQKSFEALDASTKTILTLVGLDESTLTIGGGGGQYVLFVTKSDEEFWNLISRNDDAEVIMLNAGGQIGDFPARQVSAKEDVWKAVGTFFKTGNLDPELQWEKQV